MSREDESREEMAKVKISIIIPTYNRANSLKDTLESILMQHIDIGLDYEVIVSDNNSNDNTKEVVSLYREKFGGRLKYIFESRQGKSYALNSAIDLAEGEIFAFTDDDVILDEDWLLNIYKCFEQYNVAFLVGVILPKFLTPPPDWIDERFYGMLGIHKDHEKNFRIIRERKFKNIVFGANMAVKHDIFKYYGIRYSTECVLMQDTCLIDELLSKGFWGAFCSNVIVYHKIKEEDLIPERFYKWKMRRGAIFATVSPITTKSYHIFSFGIPMWLWWHLCKDFLMMFSTKKSDRILNKSQFLYTWAICKETFTRFWKSNISQFKKWCRVL